MKTDYSNVCYKNNGKLKVLIIIGTRPEIIKLSEIIKKCRKYFDCLLAHTGQNYDYNLNGVFFNDLGLDLPEIYMESVGNDLGETIGNIINCSYKLMKQIKPDALLVLGDTNSCLSSLSAKRLHIPIFHLEAGNRCKDECLPEESNRKIVDIISDVNLPYTQWARNYLFECGLPKERTFVIGSPMTEVFNKHLTKIKNSNVLNSLNLSPKNYILLSCHREENTDNKDNFLSIIEGINFLAQKYDMPILFSCHPRSKERLKEFGFQLDKRIICHEPFGFCDYNNLQLNAYAVVSDSGTLAEELNYFINKGLSFPAVSIRTSTERPESIENGNLVLAGINKNSINQAINLAVELNENKEYGSVVKDYSDDNVSIKLVKIIQSYVEIVNEFVWRK